MFSRVWIDFLLLNNIIGMLITVEVSFNQPKFHSDATWNSNATTFADRNFLGSHWPCIFVNSNNSIYILNQKIRTIHIWQNETDLNPTKIVSNSISLQFSMFVTTNGDIYADNGKNSCIDKWIVENETWISVMNVSLQCYGLFIDIYENLYCSMAGNHRVDKKWSNGTTTIVAGTGVRGSKSNMLSEPWGIFVDIDLDLYVADYLNHRIQLFRLNQRNGITVAGKESSKVTIKLYYPTGIVLDGDQHLFIVDGDNNRIIGSDKNGFRCIFGCSGEKGSTSDKLYHPRAMSFDSYGNIYVTDAYNHRIQKIVKNNICDNELYLRTSKEQTEYSSSLSVNSHRCNRLKGCRLLNYYCEMIEINTREEGLYTITSHSSKDLFGYIYENNFTLFDLNINAIESDDDSHYNSQFKISLYRQANSSFILIVTTAQALEQGDFSIIVHGPSTVSIRSQSNFSFLKFLFEHISLKM